MWIASRYGFYSIVKKEDGFYIRARARKDLENIVSILPEKPEILEWDTADYRFRIIVPYNALERVIVYLMNSVDYPNFKNEIEDSPDQEDKLGWYEWIWEGGYEYQERIKIKESRVVPVDGTIPIICLWCGEQYSARKVPDKDEKCAGCGERGMLSEDYDLNNVYEEEETEVNK